MGTQKPYIRQNYLSKYSPETSYIFENQGTDVKVTPPDYEYTIDSSNITTITFEPIEGKKFDLTRKPIFFARCKSLTDPPGYNAGYVLRLEPIVFTEYKISYTVNLNTVLDIYPTTTRDTYWIECAKDWEFPELYPIPLLNDDTPKYIIEITGTFENCTCNYTNGEKISSDKPIILTPNPGYVFNSRFTGETEWGETISFENGENGTLILDISSYTDTNIILNDKYIADKNIPKFKVNITGTFENCTCNYTDGEIISSSKYIVLNANQGYKFEKRFKARTDTGETIFFNQVENNIQSISTDTYNNTNIDLFDNYIAIDKNPPPKPTYTITITGTFENCSCNYKNGETLLSDKNIIITPNPGYEMRGRFEGETEWGETIVFNIDNDGNAFIDISSYTDTNIILKDNYFATEKPNTTNLFTYLYKVTNKELQKLAKTRFKIEGGTITDYGMYISKIYKYPLNITENELIPNVDIVLANVDTNIPSTLLKNNFLKYELGVVDVPKKYNNVYDFINTTIKVHCPFVGLIELLPEYVVGYKLSVYFNVDLYSGECTVTINSTFTNNPIYVSTVELNQDIPYILDNKVSKPNDFKKFIDYKPGEIFVEVIRNIPYTTKGLFGSKIDKVDYLKNYKGFTKISEIQLNTKATQEEQTEIKQLLMEGVMLNENISVS